MIDNYEIPYISHVLHILYWISVSRTPTETRMTCEYDWSLWSIVTGMWSVRKPELPVNMTDTCQLAVKYIRYPVGVQSVLAMQQQRPESPMNRMIDSYEILYHRSHGYIPKCNLKTFLYPKLSYFLFRAAVFIHLKSPFAAHFKLCKLSFVIVKSGRLCVRVPVGGVGGCLCTCIVCA